MIHASNVGAIEYFDIVPGDFACICIRVQPGFSAPAVACGCGG